MTMFRRFRGMKKRRQMRWALRSYLREKKTNSAPVINDVFRDVREKYIPTDIEVLGTVLDSLQINQYIAYRGLSPEKISRSLNSIKFQKTKKAVVALPRDIRLLIKKNGYELAETRSKIAWRLSCLQHLVYSLSKLIILLTQRVFKKQRLPQKQYIYLYNFPAESADSIIKVVIDEGRDCGPSKAAYGRFRWTKYQQRE